MAVLFPTPTGYTLNPAHQAEMLQGFLNIENAEGSTNGQLTNAQIQDYQQKHFNTQDTNAAVASYLGTNFNYLSQISSPNNTISVDDLVQFQHPLPSMPTVNNPPIQNWPGNGTSGTGTGNTVVPIFIPYPVQTPNYGGYGTTTNPGQSIPGNNGIFGSFNGGTSAQSMPQMMLLLLEQMLQMFSSYK